MRRLIQAIVIGAVLAVAAPAHALSEVPAEDYINLTTMSDRIVLVDVESVEVSSIDTKKGIETRKVVVVGKRIETIRGDDAGPEFRDQSEELRIANIAEAERSLPEEVIEMLHRPPPHSASQCKKGHRYLVIFLDGGTIFFEVPVDNDGWRKRILKPYRVLLEEGKRKKP